VAEALNSITQQNIGAQSQSGLLGLFKQMLSGEHPGSSMTADEKGMNLKLPSTAFKSIFGEDQPKGEGLIPGDAGAIPGTSGGGQPAPLNASNYTLGATPPNVGNAPAAPNVPQGNQMMGFLSRLLNPQQAR